MQKSANRRRCQMWPSVVYLGTLQIVAPTIELTYQTKTKTNFILFNLIYSNYLNILTNLSNKQSFIIV